MNKNTSWWVLVQEGHKDIVFAYLYSDIYENSHILKEIWMHHEISNPKRGN